MPEAPGFPPERGLPGSAAHLCGEARVTPSAQCRASQNLCQAPKPRESSRRGGWASFPKSLDPAPLWAPSLSSLVATPILHTQSGRSCPATFLAALGSLLCAQEHRPRPGASGRQYLPTDGRGGAGRTDRPAFAGEGAS